MEERQSTAPALFRLAFCKLPPASVLSGQYFPLIFDVVNEYGESCLHLFYDVAPVVKVSASIVNASLSKAALRVECKVRLKAAKEKSKNPPLNKRKRYDNDENLNQTLPLPGHGVCNAEACICLPEPRKGGPKDHDLLVQLHIELDEKEKADSLGSVHDIGDLVGHSDDNISYRILPLYSLPFKLVRGSPSTPSTVGESPSQFCERHIKLNAKYDNIVFKERHGFGELGGRIWTGALVLSTYLRAILEKNQSEFEGKSIIELGSGCGLVGMAMALLTSATVTLTDLEGPVLDLLRDNVKANAGEVKERVFVDELDWEKEIDDKILKRGPFDYILVADCTYNESVYGILADTIAKLSTSNTITFISHTLRADEEQKILKGVCMDKGFSFDIVSAQGPYCIYRLRLTGGSRE